MTQVIILAAGKGTRIISPTPKVLVPLCGKPLIYYVLDAARMVSQTPAIIVGYKGKEVIAACGDGYAYIWQKEQLGTGHAIRAARSILARSVEHTVLVLNGDHPMVRGETLCDLVASHEASGAVMTITSAVVPHFEDEFSLFAAFGRIIRNSDGSLTDIKEVKDAQIHEQTLKEVNVGYYCFNASWLWRHIDLLTNHNNSGEYYLTDLVGIACGSGEKVHVFTLADPREGMGMNTREEHLRLEQIMKDSRRPCA